MHPHGDHPLAGRFNALDPFKILDVVHLPGLTPTGRIIALNSYENRVYQIDAEDAEGRLRSLVGKFYRPGRWSRAALEDEHDFLFDLDEAGVPVALPLFLDDGETTVGELTGEAEGICYALFDKVPGRAPEELTDRELAELGQALGRVHAVGAQHAAPDRPVLSPQTHGWDNLSFLLENDRLPLQARDTYAGIAEALLDRIGPLFEGVPVHRIHGDCHKGNLIRRGGNRRRAGLSHDLVFLDFDDLTIGPAVQDIWLIAPDSDAEGHRQRLLLTDGYRQERDFDPHWLTLVEPLRGLRMMHYATWIARRFDDPTFRRTFDYFGTVRYWQSQAADLREVLARLDREPDDFS